MSAANFFISFWVCKNIINGIKSKLYKSKFCSNISIICAAVTTLGTTISLSPFFSNRFDFCIYFF